MKIDNSQANAFWFCPRKWQEVNQVGIQKAPSGDARDFGKLIHERLKQHFLEIRQNESDDLAIAESELKFIEHAKSLDHDIVNEAEEMFQSYVAHYPIEDFDVVEVEQYFEVPLPKSRSTGIEHTYVGKRDGVVRGHKSGRLRLLEHKSEQRNSKSNLPEVWAARAQVGLYLYAGELDFKEPFDDIILDVLTRRSPAGRFPCSFRRDNLQRTDVQIRQATENIVWVADQITMLKEKFGDDPWPEHTENCSKWGYKCDFYGLHITMEGQHDLVYIQKYYVPTEKYLEL